MPRGVKSLLQSPSRIPVPDMSLDPALRSRIESLLQSNRVVLFMKGQPTMPQ
ncbi:MAG TPA: monothiol glutaredoxin, Grx4 family, partial [Pseudoxanthomonas sp.]